MTAKILDIASFRSSKNVAETAPAEKPKPAPFTWTPPPERVGSKFNRNLSTTEIAELGRREIKALIAREELPKGLKVSVRSRSYSGGSSIDVSVTACPFEVLNPERLAAELADPHEFIEEYRIPRLRPEARDLLARISAVFQAYNRDSSDSSVDYFNVNFYGGTATFDSSITDAERKAYAALASSLPLPV